MDRILTQQSVLSKKKFGISEWGKSRFRGEGGDYETGDKEQGIDGLGWISASSSSSTPGWGMMSYWLLDI